MKDFNSLMEESLQISKQHGDVIFIGGIAVYLHTINNKYQEIAEATRDADIYVSMNCLSSLRDVEEVFNNSRLSKSEFQRAGFSFDVYTQHQSRLIIPYDVVEKRSDQYGDIRVASLEDLLILKLEAAENRQNSSHGIKDDRDIIRLLLVADKKGDLDYKHISDYMHDRHYTHLKKIVNGNEYMSIAMNNSKKAKELRLIVGSLFEKIEKEYLGMDIEKNHQQIKKENKKRKFGPS